MIRKTSKNRTFYVIIINIHRDFLSHRSEKKVGVAIYSCYKRASAKKKKKKSDNCAIKQCSDLLNVLFCGRSRQSDICVSLSHLVRAVCLSCGRITGPEGEHADVCPASSSWYMIRESMEFIAFVLWFHHRNHKENLAHVRIQPNVW